MTLNRIAPRRLILRSLLLPELLILSIGISASAQTPAPAPSLIGNWKVHIVVAGNEQDQKCSFTQTDKAIAGTCDSDHGPVKVTGSVDGNKATWKFDSEYQGTPITLTYTGAFDDKGKLSGSIDVQPFNVSGDFDVSPADAAAQVTATTAATNAPVTVAASSASAASTAGGPATSLTGSWHVHTTVQGTDYESDCVLTQTDKALAGTCKSDMGESKLAGSVDGTKATWKYDSEYQGTPITLTYTGAFGDKGKFGGTVDVQPFAVTGDFLMTPTAK